MITLILSWLPVTLDCVGRHEFAVSYAVRAGIGVMAFVAWCPLDLNGQVQRCPVWTDLSVETAMTSINLPEPQVGEVLAWEDPVTVDAAGNRSDDPGGCAP